MTWSKHAVRRVTNRVEPGYLVRPFLARLIRQAPRDPHEQRRKRREGYTYARFVWRGRPYCAVLAPCGSRVVTVTSGFDPYSLSKGRSTIAELLDLPMED